MLFSTSPNLSSFLAPGANEQKSKVYVKYKDIGDMTQNWKKDPFSLNDIGRRDAFSAQLLFSM